VNIIGAILGSTGLASLIFTLAILAGFGRKLGIVTAMRPYYKGYYAAIALLGLALVARFVRVSTFWAPPGTMSSVLNDPVFYLIFYHLPLALGLCVGLGITWRYWSWLLKER
jgi:hypothetical protein